jgi:hypothetical protein
MLNEGRQWSLLTPSRDRELLATGLDGLEEIAAVVNLTSPRVSGQFLDESSLPAVPDHVVAWLVEHGLFSVAAWCEQEGLATSTYTEGAPDQSELVNAETRRAIEAKDLNA